MCGRDVGAHDNLLLNGLPMHDGGNKAGGLRLFGADEEVGKFGKIGALEVVASDPMFFAPNAGQEAAPTAAARRRVACLGFVAEGAVLDKVAQMWYPGCQESVGPTTVNADDQHLF